MGVTYKMEPLPSHKRMVCSKSSQDLLKVLNVELFLNVLPKEPLINTGTNVPPLLRVVQNVPVVLLPLVEETSFTAVLKTSVNTVVTNKTLVDSTTPVLTTVAKDTQSVQNL